MKRKEEAIKKIIEASLIEFGTKGYELASTNTIYKTAGVSKGAIFLYFNSKAELFYEVFKIYLLEFVEEMSKLNLNGIDDIFDKMMEITFWKLKYFSSRPHESKLLLEAVNNPPKEAVNKIMSHYDEITKLSLTNIFKDIDMSVFSSEYTKEEVIRYVQLALNGLQYSMLRVNVTIEYLDSIREDSIKYLKTLLKGMKK